MIHKIQPEAINLKNIKLDVDVKKLNIPGCKDAWEIANNNNQMIEGTSLCIFSSQSLFAQ
jgi:hypothetical protein